MIALQRDNFLVCQELDTCEKYWSVILTNASQFDIRYLTSLNDYIEVIHYWEGDQRSDVSSSVPHMKGYSMTICGLKMSLRATRWFRLVRR